MKRQLFIILLFFFAYSLHAQRKIITVNNNPLTPGQYTLLQSAIDAASGNDTIYVSGSVTSYGNINVTKQLTIMGTAHSPDDQFDLKPTIGKITLTAAASGSVLQGLYIYQNNRLIETSNGTHNITIRNCYLKSDFDFVFVIDDNDNWTLEGNQIYAEDGCDLSDLSGNTIFKNNRFFCRYRSIKDANYTSLIFNNLFYENWFELKQFETCNNSVIFNNIFYYEAGTGNYTPDEGCSGCSFSYNLTFSPNLIPEAKVLADIPGAANFGGNNWNNVNPLFTDLSFYVLGAASPGKNAGSDGTDIGMYGANYNFSERGYSNIPQLYYLMIKNAVVPVDGTINVILKARKQD